MKIDWITDDHSVFNSILIYIIKSTRYFKYEEWKVKIQRRSKSLTSNSNQLKFLKSRACIGIGIVDRRNV